MQGRRADEVEFQTKAEIALAMMEQALEDGVPVGVVLADAAYGSDMRFRESLDELGLRYAVGIQGSTSLWRPGEARWRPGRGAGGGRPPKLLRRARGHQPATARELVVDLGPKRLKRVAWRESTSRQLSSRFLACGPAHKGLLALGAARGAVAAGRMAARGTGTGEILAGQSA